MPLSDRPARGRRSVPAAVWALTGLHLALLLVYAVAWPPYLSPDEPQHVDLVVALRAGDGWAGPGERALSQGVYVTSDRVYPEGDVPALARPYGGADFGPRSERPSLEEAGGAAPSTGALPNQLVQHPPLWYATGALLLELVPGADDLAYDRTVGLLRLLSAVLVAPLPLLAWAAARVVGASSTAALAAAVVPLAVPGVTRIGAAAGNDSLVTLAGAAATVAVLRVATGDLSRRTALAAGALVALAVLSKGFGLVLVPCLVAAYVLAAVRRRAWRPAVVPALLAGGVAGLGLLWWLRNLVLYGAVQPNGFGREVARMLAGPPRPEGTSPDVVEFARLFVDALLPRFWAPLGVVEPPTFTDGLSVLLTVLLVGGVVAGLVRGRARPALLLALAPLVLLLAITVESAWSSYVTYARPPGVQGRYLYAAVAGVAVVAGIGVAVRRWVPLALLGLALALQGWALRLAFGDFYVPDGAALGAGVRSGVEALLAVSAWPAWVTVLVLATPVLAGGAAMTLVARPAVQTAADDWPRPQVEGEAPMRSRRTSRT